MIPLPPPPPPLPTPPRTLAAAQSSPPLDSVLSPISQTSKFVDSNVPMVLSFFHVPLLHSPTHSQPSLTRSLFFRPLSLPILIFFLRQEHFFEIIVCYHPVCKYPQKKKIFQKSDMSNVVQKGFSNIGNNWGKIIGSKK